MLYATGATTLTAGYGYHSARPRWSYRKSAILGGAAFALGTFYGGFKRYVAHRQFTQSLDNPEGFVIALIRVHKRLGGDGNIGFTLRRIQQTEAAEKHPADNTYFPETVHEERNGESFFFFPIIDEQDLWA